MAVIKYLQKKGDYVEVVTDDDPSLVGYDFPVNSIIHYNGYMYVKKSASLFDWGLKTTGDIEAGQLGLRTDVDNYKNITADYQYNAVYSTSPYTGGQIDIARGTEASPTQLLDGDYLSDMYVIDKSNNRTLWYDDYIKIDNSTVGNGMRLSHGQGIKGQTVTQETHVINEYGRIVAKKVVYTTTTRLTSNKTLDYSDSNTVIFDSTSALNLTAPANDVLQFECEITLMNANIGQARFSTVGAQWIQGGRRTDGTNDSTADNALSTRIDHIYLGQNDCITFTSQDAGPFGYTRYWDMKYIYRDKRPRNLGVSTVISSANNNIHLIGHTLLATANITITLPEINSTGDTTDSAVIRRLSEETTIIANNFTVTINTGNVSDTINGGASLVISGYNTAKVKPIAINSWVTI